MANAASYAEEHGIALAMKPHGGASGASEEILRCIEKVEAPQLQNLVRRGNIIYYTGKDPLRNWSLSPNMSLASAAKDCAEQKGNVDDPVRRRQGGLRAIFSEAEIRRLRRTNNVECCALASTPQEVAVNARRNREFWNEPFLLLDPISPPTFQTSAR